MKKILITLFILLFTARAFCQLTYTQDLKHIAQIKFPDTPEVENVNLDGITYKYHAEHDTYFAYICPLEKSFKDLFTKDINDQFYNHFVKGSLKSTRGRLFYKKHKLINGIQGIEYSFSFDTLGIKYYNNSRLVFYNDTLVNFSLISTDTLQKGDQKLNTYFSSFKITIPKNDIVSQNNTAIIAGLAKITANIILIVIPVLIGLGIVFLIRKIAYRKDNP